MKDANVINLLPREEYGYRKKQQILQVINLFMFVIVIGLGIVTALVWSVTFVLTRQVAIEEQKIASLQQRLSNLSPKEQKLQLLSNRLTTAAKILSDRSPLQDRIDNLSAKLPTGVTIVSVSVDDRNKSITLTVKSDTYSGFGNLLPILGSTGFEFAKADKISRGDDGIYTISLEVTLS